MGGVGGWGAGTQEEEDASADVPYAYPVPSAVETVSHDIPECRFYKPVHIGMQSAVPFVASVGEGVLGPQKLCTKNGPNRFALL